MKLKTILSMILGLAVQVAAQAAGTDPASWFDSHVIEHDFGKEGVRKTGATDTIQARMAHYKIPGMALSVIQNGRISWETSHGFLKAGKAEMAEPDSLFQAGSVTKVITALLVMHHVERGVFDLDADVNTYLESWQMPENEFNRVAPVTLRLLLAHQSGLPLSNIDREPDQPWPTLPQIMDGVKPAINEPAMPAFTPGEKWSYSNIGYALLQLVLEDTLHKGLAELASEIIFEPLEMESSTFEYPLAASMKHREALPHASGGEPRDAVLDSLAIGQGGLLTTTGDMSRLLIELMRAYRGESDTIITRDTFKQMLTRQVDVPAAVFGFPVGMGLGLFVDGSGDDIALMHPGHSYPGTTFLVLAFPARGEGMAMGTNGNLGDRLQIEAASTLAGIYGWPAGDYYGN